MDGPRPLVGLDPNSRGLMPNWMALPTLGLGFDPTVGP